jgi:3'-phosphoadenosine 5'-phosphosulfate (PAPS) 3'-phosphatase
LSFQFAEISGIFGFIHSTISILLSTPFIQDLQKIMRFVGQQAIQKRKEPEFTIFVKEDKSLVTNVDYWANEELTLFLKNAFPDHVIIGEESKDKYYAKESPFVWYVDPIDGTKQYTQGEDHFYILVGLAVNGFPEFGFFYKPAEDLFIFTDSNAQINMEMKGFCIEIPALNWNKPGSLVLKYATLEQKNYLAEIFSQEKHRYIHEMVSQLGPIFKESNGYLGFRRTYFWDICAPSAIMNKLGFKQAFFDADGNPMLLNSGLVKCRSYYSLPADAPNELISWFEEQVKHLSQETI